MTSGGPCAPRGGTSAGCQLGPVRIGAVCTTNNQFVWGHKSEHLVRSSHPNTKGSYLPGPPAMPQDTAVLRTQLQCTHRIRVWGTSSIQRTFWRVAEAVWNWFARHTLDALLARGRCYRMRSYGVQWRPYYCSMSVPAVHPALVGYPHQQPS